MYKYAKQTIDTMVQRWDGGDLYAHYAQRDPDIAKNMLKDWRQKQSDLIEFKRNGFKNNAS